MLSSHCKPYNNHLNKTTNYPNKIKEFLTKFLPSTITRFCDRITRLITPVSPLSLPLIIITCNNQSPSKPKKKNNWKPKKNHIMLKRKQTFFFLTLSPLRTFQCLMSFWAAFQPISDWPFLKQKKKSISQVQVNGVKWNWK